MDRQSQGLAAAGYQQEPVGGHRQRQRQEERRALARGGRDLHFPLPTAHLLAHHRQSHAAAGQLGDHPRGGQAGSEDQGDDTLGGEGAGFPRRQQPAPDGGFGHALVVDAPPVVLDPNLQAGAADGQGQCNAAGPRLAARLALVRRLDAVADGVAHQVHHRVLQAVQHHAVGLRFESHHLEVDFLALIAGQVADHLTEALEYGRGGGHAGLPGVLLEPLGPLDQPEGSLAPHAMNGARLSRQSQQPPIHSFHVAVQAGELGPGGQLAHPPPLPV